MLYLEERIYSSYIGNAKIKIQADSVKLEVDSDWMSLEELKGFVVYLSSLVEEVKI